MGFKNPGNESFPLREKRILDFWKKHNIFHASLKKREKGKYFSFFDGPPFATGLPHYGHLLAGTIKDVVLRFKTMEGFYAPRRFGWDCHGLPIEQEIEKIFHLTGKEEIERFGIARYNEECRAIVLRFAEQWQTTVEGMGRLLDFSETFKTMDPPFMESVWWVFKQLYEKGLIYEGLKVMPFSAKLGTPLSNFEASENYKEVDDPSIVVAFALEDDPKTKVLIWTTTPWTLISNLAVTVHPEIDYVLYETESQERYIVAEALVKKWMPAGSILKTFKGKELENRHYIPCFSYFQEKRKENAFRIILDAFVTLDEGTGLVHTAPAFGESDFYACEKAGILPVCPIDQNGRFTEEIQEFAHSFVKDADKQIIAQLKEKGALFYRGTIRHRYPFCWRSDTPLIYRTVTTWFMKVSAIKDQLVKNNQEIHWVPDHLKDGRFGKWLENARDWAISRNRYWGTPIPLWRSEDGDIHVVGSVAELADLTGKKIEDLHRHFVDALTFQKKGKTYRRIEEVFDCWFDTGSMPYAQNHYPFENKEETEKRFPADFIAEGVDQTRGWFYTLHILATALFDQPAFRNVITNGIILAEDGAKMSKRLKNYPEPSIVMEKYGADAIRLYMLHSAAVKAEDLRFSENGVEQILKQILIPLWNAQYFFLTYAEIYHWKPEKLSKPYAAKIDRWILAKLHALIGDVKKGMDEYELSLAVEPFVGFIDDLTNWYIRRGRRRFWSDVDNVDRKQAFATLYEVLLELCKISASFIPFLSEALYQNLRTSEQEASVHLCDYPTIDPSQRDDLLEKGMDLVQVAVSLGHALRKEYKIKVRQPLMRAHIECHDSELFAFLQEEKALIQDELNVKEVVFHKESQNYVRTMIKPNYRVLGKKVKTYMKEAKLLIEELGQDQIDQLLADKTVMLELGGELFALQREDVEISHQVHEGVIAMHGGGVTVALDTDLTEELILEGIARELVNKVNHMRKNRELQVTDRIVLFIAPTDRIVAALKLFGDYVKEETLTEKLLLTTPHEAELFDINGEPSAIHLEKVTL